MMYEYNPYLIEIMEALGIEEQYRGVVEIDTRHIVDKIEQLKKSFSVQGAKVSFSELRRMREV